MNVEIKKKITYGVCLVHCAFIALILFKAPLRPAKKQAPIVVKTVVMQQTEKKIAPKAPTASRTAKARVPATPPVPAPKKAAASEKKPAPKATKPVPKIEKTEPSISPALLRELEESIAKIEEKEDKQKKVIKKTAPLSLQIDAPEVAAVPSTQIEQDYIAVLTETLHASLHLPEFGEVKIELTLNQDGTVAKLRVLKTESVQNRKYLEAELPRLKFPFFRGSYAKQTAHTFTLTFCNEP